MADKEPKDVVEEIINPDPFCPVRLTRMVNRGRTTDKWFIELQKPESEDWQEVAGTKVVHSANYRLVTNAEVHRMAADVMGQTGLAFQPVPTWGGGHSKGLIWNGRYYLERWYTPDVKVQSPHGADIMLGMEVRNSYDKSCRVGLAFFAMHCACSNQFYGRNLLGEPFNFSHIGDAGELSDNVQDALATLTDKARGFGKIVPTINLLTGTSVAGMDDFLALRRKVVETTGLEFRDRQILDELSGNGITKKVGISVGEAYGSPSSFWAITNAFTAITTHQVGGLRGQDQAARFVDFMIDEAKARNAAVA